MHLLRPLFDPEEDEVLIGAEVRIVNVSNGKEMTVKTDDFGDFWVDSLAPAKYSIVIKMDGYSDKILDADLTVKDFMEGHLPYVNLYQFMKGFLYKSGNRLHTSRSDRCC
jgi:hypothetical protein